MIKNFARNMLRKILLRTLLKPGKMVKLPNFKANDRLYKRPVEKDVKVAICLDGSANEYVHRRFYVFTVVVSLYLIISHIKQRNLR